MSLHPQAELLIAAAAATDLPPIETLSPSEARALYNQRSSDLPADPVIGEISERMIPGPGGELALRIYRPVDSGPATSDGTVTPALMFFHGGGWVIGDLDTHDIVCRALCEATAATVVSVDYRLAPEHPFPAAADDCTAATVWVGNHGEAIGVDPTRIAVCGDSAGGNLAAVTALDLAGDPNGPKISAQALVYPATDATREQTGSLVDCAEGFLLTTTAMSWFYDQYAPDRAMRTDPRCSPALGELKGQPPTIVVSAEFDPLRDEGVEYAAALSDVGVDVELVDVPGQIHTFFTQVGVCDASDDAVEKIAAFVTRRW